MPFFTLTSGGWVRTVDVGLTQLGETGPKPLFRVITGFGYVPRKSAERLPVLPEPDEDRRVHEHDETDLASVPPFLWGVIASYGNHTMPALLHDRLCNVARGRNWRVRLAERRVADQLFRTMLRDEARMGIATRWVMWAAVRLFGVIAIGVGVLLWCVAAALYRYVDAVPPALGRGLLVGLGALVLVAMASCSVEAATGDRPRLRLASFLEWVAAALIGSVAVVPLLPVILVTLATRLMIWIADVILLALHVGFVQVPRWVWRQLTYPRVGRDLETASGDSADEVAATRRRQRPIVSTEPFPAFGRVFPRF